MKRIVISASFILLSSLTISANPIDVQQAKQIARTTLLENVEHGTRKLALGNVEMMVVAQDELQELPAYFICQPSSGNGFVIVSGDDSEDSILGYSTEGNIDVNNMPPALREILDGYSKHISQVRSGEAEPFSTSYSESPKKTVVSVSALCKSTWSQASPFYNQCPTDNGTHCLVGCVATSASQIMYYHKYPSKGTGKVSTRYGSQTLELNLDDVPFDWDNMLDSYKGEYTDDQANAVATLCQAVGYGAKMNYGTGFSGAYVSDVLYALINNFNYSTTAKVYLRNSYTEDSWLNKLKEELEAGRPMIYGGYTTSNAGHNFVCDGFNYKNQVHINWGWGGDYNGFYNFRVLSPNKSKPEEGYSQNQQIVMGIQPMVEGEDRSVQYQIFLNDSVSYEQNGNNFSLRLPSLTNETYEQATGAIYYVIMKSGEEQGNIRLCNYKGSVDVAGRSQYIDFTIPSDLPDGEYDLKLAFKTSQSDKWYWLESGDMLSVIHIKVSNGSVISSEIVTDIVMPTVTNIAKESNNIIYNIQGQRVSNPQHGLYIKNGKKIITR